MFAIMPPQKLSARIDDERRNFAEKYKCVRALKQPVHITLFDPFKAYDDVEKEMAKLQTWADRQKPFEVELKNYNYFRHSTKPVIYIDVVKNEQLSAMHLSFLHELDKHMPLEAMTNKYTPHITIGYRDIPVEIFPDIMHDYSKRRFSASFEVSTVYFWKHNGLNWQIQKEFKMGVAAEYVQQQVLF